MMCKRKVLQSSAGCLMQVTGAAMIDTDCAYRMEVKEIDTKGKKAVLNSVWGVTNATRKFRKMGEIMTVVNKDDYVLFGVDTHGRIFKPSPPPTNTVLYKYETLRKRLCEGKSWWEEKI